MKPSSSSSSLAFFESQTSGSGGCLLGVLRRILCSRSSLPSDACSCSAAKEGEMMTRDDNQAAPGLVARLMGLDSIPERSRITRSRSLNSADHSRSPQHDYKDEDLHRKLHQHKRSKSSRDIPTYIDLDDDDYIVLRFENRPKPKKSPRTNPKRDLTAPSPEKHLEEQKQHSRLLPNAQVDSSDTEESSEIGSCNQREANSRIKKHVRLVQKTTQSSSSDREESSPVSIFDFQESTSDDDSWTRSSGSSSRVSSPEQDSNKISTSLATEAVEGRHKAALLNNTVVQKKKSAMWGIVCDVTAAEIKGAADTDWCGKEGLAAEFEVHIMDQLLNDLLLQLNSI